MATVLTDRQKDDLHKSMIHYLVTSGYSQSAEAMKEEVPNMSDYEPDPKDKNAGLLIKKWTGVIRLQKKVIELEQRLTQALEEVSQLGHLSAAGPAKKGQGDWLPTVPAKHTLIGHRAPVRAVAFHPAFSVLASASDDNSVKIWDWESGELERTLKGHTRDVTDCHFDSKGKLLVSSSHDLFVKLWNVENDYQNSATLRGHEHSVSSARFLPGDTRIITASRDQTVRIWEIATTHCVKVIRAHEDWVRCAIPTADGRLFLTCSNDKSARIVDTESGTVKTEMREHEHVVEVAVFAPPIASPPIRELANLPTVKSEPPTPSFVATGSRDKTIKLWDAQNGSCLKTLQGHDNWVKALVFHPSGKFLLSAADDKTIRVWELKTGRCLKRLEAHDAFVSCMTWGRSMPNSEKDAPERLPNVIATGSSDNNIKIWLPGARLV